MVREADLPPDAAALTTLARLDYHDCFVVDGLERRDRTPEEWFRALVDSGSSKTRAKLRTAWLALGLKLGPSDAPDLVLGWPIRRSTSDHVLLGTDSRAGFSAELLLKLEPATLLFATLVQLHNSLGRGLWESITPRHQRVVHDLLAHGVR